MDIANTQRLSLTKKIGAHYQITKKIGRLPFNGKAVDAMSYIANLSAAQTAKAKIFARGIMSDLNDNVNEIEQIYLIDLKNKRLVYLLLFRIGIFSGFRVINNSQSDRVLYIFHHISDLIFESSENIWERHIPEEIMDQPQREYCSDPECLPQS
ncbi:hypothetical protein C1646_668363 [Rhizophagus diaphanus]|nr:hypothetical protein C1646_668363 [Rhizophagus diaphanus] [Rhizophagus sp. MUCL 43196]